MQIFAHTYDRSLDDTESVSGHARRVWILGVGVIAFWAVLCSPSQARLGVSPVIVDFQPEQPQNADIELFNDGPERVYVVVEPSEIKGAGTPTEQRIQVRDPKLLGLLAVPSRLILEPGQRKFLRIVMLDEPASYDRIYRVTVKPVTGEVEAPVTGVKILVGYDLLVIQRPKQPKADIKASRSGTALTLTNDGNTNAELFNGRACDAGTIHCNDLPGHRLYAGASWTVPIIASGNVEYTVKTGETISTQKF